MTILVVDDEEMIRTMASRALLAGGFNVLTAVDGFEAVEVFQKQGERIAAVLLDVRMPRMSGEQVLIRLRSIRSDVRVILSSGTSVEGMSDEMTQVDAFLPKPYDTKTLLRLVNRIVCG